MIFEQTSSAVALNIRLYY